MRISFKNFSIYLYYLLVYFSFVIPRSFFMVKAIVLAILLVFSIASFRTDKSFIFLLKFYSIIIIIGIFSSFIGLIYDNPIEAILDGFRVYFIWPIVIIIITGYVYKFINFNAIDNLITLAAFSILFINFIFLLQNYLNIQYISDYIIKEMVGNVGIHEVYIQITSHNIGSLFIIDGYFLSKILFEDKPNLKTKLGLFASFLITIISGRRALWLSTLIIFVICFIKNPKKVYTSSRNTLILFLISISLIFIIIEYDYSGLFQHILSAFGSTDERSIQFDYLLSGIINHPIFGSGFGGYAGYIRNEENPWMYELTYMDNIYHFGIPLVVALYSVLFFYTIKAMMQPINSNELYLVCIGFGLLNFLIGLWSNPYFGSFDFLLQISLLPLLLLRTKHK